jgi:hypothetical protein
VDVWMCGCVAVVQDFPHPPHYFPRTLSEIE